jgi:hypothetical protein
MKTVIQIAREAGDVLNKEWLERFAELVRADERNRTWTQEHWTEYERSIAAQEREACAKVCETEWSNVAERMYGEECAAAIRARRNT